jgi:hypothetical protein
VQPYSIFAEGAPDAGNAPGIFVTLQPIAGDNPSSSLGSIQVNFEVSNYAWLRVRIDKFTGMGSVFYVLQSPAPQFISGSIQGLTAQSVSTPGQIAILGSDYQSLTFDSSLTWDPIGKRLIVGPDLGLNATSQIYRPEYLSTGGDAYAQYINFNQSPSTTGTIFGSYVNVAAEAATGITAQHLESISRASGEVAHLYGTEAWVGDYGSGNSPVDIAMGYYTDFTFTSPATVKEARGYTVVLGVGPSAGNIADYKGFFFAGTQPDTLGTITNQYAFYADNVTQATGLNYAIYTNLGKIRFGDSVGIGTPAFGYPNSALEVAGAIQIDPQSADPACSKAKDVGKIWFDNTTSTTVRKTCNSVNGSVQWVQF